MCHHDQKNQTLYLQILLYSEIENNFFYYFKIKHRFLAHTLIYIYTQHEIDTCNNIYTCKNMVAHIFQLYHH